MALGPAGVHADGQGAADFDYALRSCDTKSEPRIGAIPARPRSTEFVLSDQLLPPSNGAAFKLGTAYRTFALLLHFCLLLRHRIICGPLPSCGGNVRFSC